MRSSAAPDSGRNADETPLNVDQLRRFFGFQAAVFVFYAADGLLFTALAALGSLPIGFGTLYAAAGWFIAGITTVMFRRGRKRLRELDRTSLALSAGGGTLMLVAALVAPSVGGLMLMSLMTVLTASALQLGRRDLLATWLAFALGTTATMLACTEPLGLPMATPAQRLLCALWFAWLLAKCALTNVEGTRLRKEVGEANARLRQALADLAKIATTDELTVLPNRRSIVLDLCAALEAGIGAPTPVAVALLDIDHFKSVNDRYGHATGDTVLCEFAALVARGLRPDDRVGRYGGEEFLIVLRQVNSGATAHETVDRTRRSVETFDWSRLVPGLRITASAGVALVAADEPAANAIARADLALYAAKAEGRNRVLLADDAVPLGAFGPVAVSSGAA